MRPVSPIALGLAFSLALLLTWACACSGRNDRPGAEAIVTGTVLDAATGTPLADVRIEGPHGARAVTASDGRFEMEGLREGDEGQVLAQTSDGRRGSVTLRPLPAGRREVVLHVSRR